eukprot:5117583-Pyramimonas_sp.AAC.2
MKRSAVSYLPRGPCRDVLLAPRRGRRARHILMGCPRRGVDALCDACTSVVPTSRGRFERRALGALPRARVRRNVLGVPHGARRRCRAVG